MRATLIFNPNAAGTSGSESRHILELLQGAGYEARHAPTESEADLAEALAKPGDLVVVAGGDGSVRNTALALQGRGVPLAILPMGTANNIAHSLGLTDPLAELVAGLANPRCYSFDLGRVVSAGGTDSFLEGCGLGLFADTMAAYDPDEGKSILRALGATLQTLAEYRPSHLHIVLDETDLSGEYLLVEVMNTRQVGPRLMLAPEADPGDGLFDLVLVHEDHRVHFGAYLQGLMTGDLERLDNVSVRRGRRLELVWDGSPLHIDGSATEGPVLSSAGGQSGQGSQLLQIGVEAGALELWLPQAARERRSP